MKLKQWNIKGFFYVWFFIFTFPSRWREGGVDSLYCENFKWTKIFGDQKICTGDQI